MLAGRYPPGMELMHRLLSLLGIVTMVLSALARKETSKVSPTGFTSTFREVVKASPDDVWKTIVQLPRRWSNQHTWSGQASNMSLDAQAGGCWCERWADGQSVRHGHVLLVQPGRVIRLFALLGPLQDPADNRVLTLVTGA